MIERWDFESAAHARKEANEREWDALARELPARTTTMFDVTASVATHILDAVKAGPGMAILDVGCGPCTWAPAILGRGARLTGLDFSASMIEIARRRHPEATFIHGDAEDLQFADSSFDAVLCNFGVASFPEPQEAMAEAWRVLKPAGVYAFTTWCALEQSAFGRLLASAVGARAANAAKQPPFHQSPDVLVELLDEIGFIDAAAQPFTVTARLSAAENVLDLVYTVAKNRAFLNAKPQKERHRIEQAIVESARELGKGGPLVIELPAILSRGRKPQP